MSLPLEKEFVSLLKYGIDINHQETETVNTRAFYEIIDRLYLTTQLTTYPHPSTNT